MDRRNNARRGSLVRALAARELGGNHDRVLDYIPRRRWAIGQVLSPEDCSVLLGFSSDGNYLVYYSVWETSYMVQWKRIQSSIASDRVELKPTLQLTSPSGGTPNVGTSLRIWQSTDDHLIAVVATDSPIASQYAGPSYHVTLSPSPVFSDQHATSHSRSISFSYTLPSATQDLESWQLVTISHHTYLFILNMGSSVAVLALRLASGYTSSNPVVPFCLPKIGFEDREWYASSEYPIEFFHTDFDTDAVATNLVHLQCICQQEFDCEAFLASFFRKYVAFRHLHLVDYDLQLVRTCLSEKSLFMTCTADLESSPSITSRSIEQSRLALFFVLEVFTGEYHVVRALKVPRHQPLRQMSSVLARKFRTEISERTPPDPIPSEWNNESVLRHQSLSALHNPRFPVSIYLK